MSVDAMSLVWKLEGLSSTDKLVLLSLADHAGEDDTCYPSISRLCLRTGLKERTVQTALKRLVESGFLAVKMNGGRHGSNLYKLHLTPAADAPINAATPQQMHPAADAPPRSRCTEPPHLTAITPAADAPKPSVTIKEPSVKRRRASEIDPDAVMSDRMHRAAERRSLSQQEAEAQFQRFKNSAKAKGRTYVDWDAAFETWLDSPYFKPVTGGRNDQATGNHDRRSDPALEQIARLAGLGKA